MPPARDAATADLTLVPPTDSAAGGATPPPHRDTPPVTPADGRSAGPTCPFIAGYQLLGEIGRGGMGVVYRARQTSLNRPVALKMILDGHQAGERDRARFRAEAAAVARLRHPNIVQIFEVGEQAGRAYLALELVEGGTLGEKLGGAPQPTRPAAALVEHLARGTHHAHECGVIHRDLKPGNVLLAPPPAGGGESADRDAADVQALYGVPKITDFGLAKQLQEDDGQTRSGELLGTPSYMAPEQAAGRANEVGPGADVYSLGAILYEMLTGRPPFRGATALETLHAALHDDPVPPGRLRPKLPRDLERICLKCLEKDPARRYATADDLANDLRRHLAGESVHARPAPPHERVWRWCRRNPVPAVLLVTAVVGSVSGLLYLSSLTREFARANALQAAAQQSETLDEVNKYYGRVTQNSGVAGRGEGWQKSHGSVPFPATLTIELGDRITARSETGTKVRLYSDFPFKNRADREPPDAFGLLALAEFRRDSGLKEFHRFETVGDHQVLRYATPRRMTEQACVNCHNKDSTILDKTDWKIGDVRGVLEVIRPLDRDQERVSQGLRGSALLVGGIGVGVIALSAVTLAFGTRPRRPFKPGPAPAAPGSSATPPPTPATASFRPDAPAPNPVPPVSLFAATISPAPVRGGPPMPERPDPDEHTLAPPADSVADLTLAPGQTDAESRRDPATVHPTPRPQPASDDATAVVAPGFPPSSRPVVDGDATQVSDGPEYPRAAAGGVATDDPDATRLPPSAAADGTETDGRRRGDWDGAATDAEGTRTFAGTPGSKLPVSPAARGSMVGRFALRDLHAKGGLGEVFTARDTELNREVALKRIQSRFADEPSSRRRFLTEAEITARLDHPGVVPVFGLVADAFGRPCYAMRFIRGETLKDEIDRYHKPGAARTPGADKTLPDGAAEPAAAPAPAPTPPADADDRRIAFRQLLQRFVAVCQAIAYAHSKGVIHRDLKPANVMVGAFGETLVVDWGLAKVMGDSPTPDDLLKKAHANDFRRDPDATEAPDEMTQMGVAVGTPAYMSPEQAAGRVDLVGPPADIYSLGATLYCVLAGRAPFTGGTPAETIGKVQRGDFAPPRAVNPAVSKSLEAVCLKAMATVPAARYPTAQALAADVERWLSDEPVSCHREPVTARLARWVRRHPARVAGTVSLLATALVATGVVLAVEAKAERQATADLARVTAAERETSRALADVTAARGKTEAALVALTAEEQRTREQKTAAEAARDIARDRFGLARNAFETVVLGIQARLEDRAGTQELRRELLQSAQTGLQKLLDTVASTPGVDTRDTDRMLAWARLQMGDVHRSLGNTAAAATEYEGATAAARKLADADRDSPVARSTLAASKDRLAEIYLQTGRTAAAADAARDALDLRTGLLTPDAADPAPRRDVAASQDRLAVVELERGNTAEARRLGAASLATRKALHAAAPADATAARDLARSYEREVDILLRVGDTAGAAAAVAETLKLREGLAKAAVDRVEVQREWAAAYTKSAEVDTDRGDLAGALRAYRDGLAVLTDVLARDPLSAGAKADAAEARGRIGAVLLRTGDATAALAETRESNRLCRELVAADRGSAKLRRVLARSHEYLGDVLLANGSAAEALREYEAARAIFRELGDTDPGSAGGKVDAADNAERVGTAHLTAGNLPAALAAFADVAAARDRLAAADRGSARAKRAAAAARGRLCEAHLAAGNHVQARVAAYQAVAGFRDRAAADPASGLATRDLAGAYAKWAEVAIRQADVTAALILSHKALAGFESLVAVDPSNGQALEDKAAGLEKLAAVAAARGDAAGQLAAETEALALRAKVAAAYPDSPAARRGLMASRRRVGDVYLGLRQFDAARAQFAAAGAIPAKFDAAPLFAAEAAAVADRLGLLDAIRAGATNPAGVVDAAGPDVGPRALAVLLDEAVKRQQPGNAARVAALLADHARGPGDLYLAAKGYAGAAAKATGTAKTTTADAALGTLTAAAAAGFRSADDLRAAAWDVVRDRPEFRSVEAALTALPPVAPPPHAVNP